MPGSCLRLLRSNATSAHAPLSSTHGPCVPPARPADNPSRPIYEKGLVAEVSKFLFGEGFAISGGDQWRVRRKAVGPALHRCGRGGQQPAAQEGAFQCSASRAAPLPPLPSNTQ